MTFVEDDPIRAKLVRLSQWSASQDAILTTSYADDYTVRGYAFQIQRRIALTSEQTLYWVVDFSAVAASKAVFSLPIALQSTAGLVYVDTYAATSYTGGSVETIINPNAGSAIVPQAVVKSGITPTGATLVREYAVGSKSTNQSSGGGAVSGQTPKIWGKVPLVIKMVNQESAENVLTVGFTWYEIPI